MRYSRHHRKTYRRRRGGNGATSYVGNLLGPVNTQMSQSLTSQPWNNAISAQSNQVVPQPSSGINPNIGTAQQDVDLEALQRAGRRRRRRRTRRTRRR